MGGAAGLFLILAGGVGLLVTIYLILRLLARLPYDDEPTSDVANRPGEASERHVWEAWPERLKPPAVFPGWLGMGLVALLGAAAVYAYRENPEDMYLGGWHWLVLLSALLGLAFLWYAAVSAVDWLLRAWRRRRRRSGW